MYEVVWGNGNLGTVAGIVGTFGSREQAERARDGWLARHSDNPAVGAWVRDLNAEDYPQPAAPVGE